MGNLFQAFAVQCDYFIVKDISPHGIKLKFKSQQNEFRTSFVAALTYIVCIQWCIRHAKL